MIRNYLKTALRNLWKHKLFSFINVFGLAWDFLRLLLMVGAIALPLSYLTRSYFLMVFAHHVTLGVCFGTMLLLGGLTIGWRTYRTALANPVKSLRID